MRIRVFELNCVWPSLAKVASDGANHSLLPTDAFGRDYSILKIVEIMRFRLPVLAVFFLAWVTLANSADADILVYLVGGQSNADGRANVSGLSGGLENPQNDVEFFFHTEGLLFAQSSFHPLDSVLTTLRPGQSETSEFGPAISFGRSMADFYSGADDPSIAIIKFANGGTNLHTHWQAGGTSSTAGDGSQYVIFQNTVTDGLAAIQAANPGEAVTIAGMVWVQGESDADTTANANAYEANLTNFISDIRLTYGSDLDFSIAQLSTSQVALDSGLLGTIRSGQANVAANDVNSFVVDTDDFYQGKGDGLHYNAAGQIALGNALALSFQAEPEPPTAQITVENSDSQSFGNAPLQAANYTMPAFDAGTNTKLVVGFGVEAGVSASFGVTFDGVSLTQIQTSSDVGGNEFTALFYLDGANGIGDIVVTTGPGPDGFLGNGPGIYAAALSGAEMGFETSGALGDGEAINGDLTGTLTGISDGAYVVAVFADQGRDGDQTITGDLAQVSIFSGANFDQIGSAVSIVASGFGNGSNLSVTFNDLGHVDNAFQNRSNVSYASFAAAPAVSTLLGDVNLDETVNFLDISPFIGVLSAGGNQSEADCNEDGSVDFLDISPFIGILSGT